MGYAYYEVNTPLGRKMTRGYSVACKCHYRGCKTKIDRGLAYMCAECTWYFCSEHLLVRFSELVDRYRSDPSPMSTPYERQRCERCCTQIAKDIARGKILESELDSEDKE